MSDAFLTFDDNIFDPLFLRALLTTSFALLS